MYFCYALDFDMLHFSLGAAASTRPASQKFKGQAKETVQRNKKHNSKVEKYVVGCPYMYIYQLLLSSAFKNIVFLLKDLCWALY